MLKLVQSGTKRKKREKKDIRKKEDLYLGFVNPSDLRSDASNSITVSGNCHLIRLNRHRRDVDANTVLLTQFRSDNGDERMEVLRDRKAFEAEFSLLKIKGKATP